MKFQDFKSGTFTKHDGYKAFLPSTINHSWGWDNPEINLLLEKASAELGGLNSFAELIPDIEIYIAMHIYNEANKSSRIEGTKTTIEEDLLPIEDILPEKRNDYIEVKNYIRALNYGIERVKGGFPLCNRLLREIHKILLQGARGEYKTPGEFRTSQNWIGGTRPDNAFYVPPHVSYLPELLSDFEKFIHEDNTLPHLIKIALLHYQFETIHPFLDGNGRIGRLLIPLYLLEKNILEKPCFYISDYLEKHRKEYFEALDRVRLNNDIEYWIKFFLEATIFTAQTAKNKFKAVVSLIEEYRKQLSTFSGKIQVHQGILRTFYSNPIQSSKDIQSITENRQSTVDKSLKQLIDAGILQEITGNNRNRIFALGKYIDIFRG